MSSATTTFVEACLDGQALLDDVDDWVDTWHDAGGRPRARAETLASYLGLSEVEYKIWAERPSMLRLIVTAHHQNVQVEDLESATEYALAAARSTDNQDALLLLEHLRNTGRLSQDDIAETG